MRQILLLVIFLALFPLWQLSVRAESHAPGAQDKPPDAAESVDILPESARSLGKEEQNDVRALAWLSRNDFAASGPLPDIDSPYLVFLRFRTIEGEVPIEKGLVAYKIEDMSGDKMPAREMDFRKGYFVAGLDSLAPGFYILHIGSKLEDEKKRQFSFDFSLR